MSVSQKVPGVWKLFCHLDILLISVDTSNLNILQYYISNQINLKDRILWRISFKNNETGKQGNWFKNWSCWRLTLGSVSKSSSNCPGSSSQRLYMIIRVPCSFIKLNYIATKEILKTCYGVMHKSINHAMQNKKKGSETCDIISSYDICSYQFYTPLDKGFINILKWLIQTLKKKMKTSCFLFNIWCKRGNMHDAKEEYRRKMYIIWDICFHIRRMETNLSKKIQFTWKWRPLHYCFHVLIPITGRWSYHLVPFPPSFLIVNLPVSIHTITIIRST